MQITFQSPKTGKEGSQDGKHSFLQGGNKQEGEKSAGKAA